MDQLAAWQALDLRPHLARLGRRLRLREGWLLAQRSLWIPCFWALLVQLFGRLWPIAGLWLWTLIPLLLWLLLVAGIALLRPMSPLRVARRADVELGLKERLSTAVTLQDAFQSSALPATQSPNHPIFQPSLAYLQRRDALTAAQAIAPRRAFPLPWLRRPLGVAALLVAATVTLVVLPNRMDAVLAERAQIARATEEQAARIEQLGRQVAEAQELSPEEREALQRQLAELAQKLRDNPGDREQALADITRLEETLQRQLDPQVDAHQAALDALAAQLQRLAGEEPAEVDPAEMDETLRSLAEQLAQADQAGRQALAQQLAQMAARTAQAGDADLAQALAAMARAARSGDAQAGSQAAQAAAQKMRQAQGELSAQAAQQAATRGTLSQLQRSRQAIAAAGQGQGQGAGQGQGQGTGQGQRPGQGQGQGGQGTSGQAGGGTGTKADRLPPGTGQGQADRPAGAGRRGGVGELDQQVYVPWERRAGSGDEVSIPGQDTGQGETEIREQENPLPGSSGEALVPYHEVYTEYLDAAAQAMERSYIPSGLKDVVREYFARLEP
jgi:hypothetical protein